ncbi:MAG: hypothetical protein LBE36_05255 [Flavobacteriaceae bacterium]|jgi:mevalonate kinase|nr:hypothetical protein [Flavobacteriaceae bacterium]
MKGKFFSPGKLLLTAEYVVLDGALALAVPSKLGQEFFFDEFQNAESIVVWEAFHQEKLWLSAKIDYQHWKIIETNHREAAEFVLKILQKVSQLSGSKFRSENSYFIKTNLQFPENFGLGSSSTLMNNLANWANIDAFLLNEEIFGGSGYDVAVAKEKSVVLYQLKNGERNIQKINFKPAFKNELIFIHLNQKQNSRAGIRLYQSKPKSESLIREISMITREVLNCNDLENFSELMELHEKKLSEFLGLKTAKETLFSDCPVFIKSLGAWGGDFVMSRKFPDYQNWFSKKGFSAVFGWEDLMG